MKRIQSQSDKSQLKDMSSAPIQSDDKKDTEVFKKRDIPMIRFNSSKLVGLDEKVLNLKLCNYSSDFMDELNKVLALYDEGELKYSSKLVAFVMSEVEKFILKPQAGAAKKKLVIESCKPYFNNDAELVEVIIELLFKELKQIKFIKRQALKLVRFFFKMVQKV